MTSNKNLPELPRPPDPTLFIRAGTSGIRHLFPIHFPALDCDDDDDGLFTRSISRVRSRTPTTDLCTNIEMIRNICLSIRTLEHFDVSSNDLDNLPLDIALLIHLQTFNCSHNQLTTISDLFEELNQLKEFDLSFNHFKRLPNVIYTLTQLLRLNCEHNAIKILDNNLFNLKHLKFLVLDHNQFQSFNTLDFSQLEQLEYLHIAHNQLTKFPCNLHKLTHLKNLNLSHNHLTSFPIELLLINTLDVLNLSHNSITKLSPLTDAYKRTSLIFSIDLSFNQLTRFYDYLLCISLKLDLSNNKIQTIPYDIIRKVNHNMMNNRELKMTQNPLTHPIIPLDILKNSISNILPQIRNSFDEQQRDEIVRQGFKICITGPKNSGKSSLAYCLEEYMPLIPEITDERIVNVFQFPFRFGTTNNPPLASSSSLPKSKVSGSKKPVVKLQHLEIDQRKGKKTLTTSSRRLSATTLALHSSPVPIEPIKSLPLTIFDFNGKEEYHEHISTFLDMNALHLICIHTADFHQETPMTTDMSTSPITRQLLQILQLLCEKVTDKNSLMILPIATHIDLYDQRPPLDKIQALDKINQFFKFYLQSRLEQIQFEMKQIDSLPMISSSLSDRLKTYNSLLHLHIQIESCQPISSLSYQGIDQLNQTIQHCVLTHKKIFPHIDRILPTLWADTNRDIEALADRLPVPYLLWEDFTAHIVDKHGLKNLVQDIAMSLQDQGKILMINEIGTNNRIVFLRPLWLGDLLSSLFHADFHPQSGHFHSDLIRSLWTNLLIQKEDFNHLWFILMRFLLIAYPKMNKKQLKNLLTTNDQDDIQFDDIILPYYLPLLNSVERNEERECFSRELIHSVSVSYRSSKLPFGFFHRYSVSAIMKLDIVYIKHWNNLIRGEHEDKQVQFLLETDHQTYLNCICGTNLLEQPFDEIWKVLMAILNQLEELFRVIAPNNQFHRTIQCPYCHEYSFMGEWLTPKELQGMKLKSCSLCGENVDTNYLIQPNEKKRRNEELLKKIRERKAQNNNNVRAQLLVV